MRFTDQSSRDTLVKVMTDGILLAEMQRDRELRRYDTIIIDEAHERSLNIDFILGYLKQLLPRRPDLKVIITSATIDPQRFAEHFATPDGKPAPIIEVSGRTFPVEIRYRPLVDPDRPEAEERDMVTGVCEAVEELWTERHSGTSSDILVFFSGEREIRDAADALGGMKLPVTEVVPLYGRLSAAEQHRVFAPHTGRRIVLATNVAETSLTVPGIRYVIDTGTARISRYSQRTKVQRLPIEPVSQASANQRSGRCGRVSDGIAIRLYSEDDYDSRPEFTDPEILRTNLASVILQMTSLGLGDIARFPFVDPPDSRQIADGVRLLEELQAFAPEDEAPPSGRGRRRPGRRLTAYGRTIAALPIDPRHARMVIEADRRGVLREVLVIVSALSIQDPRERPQDKQELAAASHKRFADETSDFLGWLNLWAYLKEQQRELSSSAFRRLCKAEYLHYLRVREWQDLHSQVRQAAKQAGLDVNRGDAAAALGEIDADAVHQSLLAGLLSHIGVRDEQKREYAGARGTRFGISPGSALFRKQPQFVMAEELVETSRLWARMNARIDPVWAEQLGEHLVKRQHSEPRWSGKRGSAVATERVTLYGVPLVVGRVVGLGGLDPELAPRPLHPARPRRGGLAYRAPLPARQRRPHRSARRARGAHPAPRHRRRRQHADRLLRQADPCRRRLGSALRLVVEEGASPDSGAADLHRGAAAARERRQHRRRGPPDDVDAGRERAADHLPVRAGVGAGRRDRPHPGRPAQPGDARRLRLAGAGLPARSWSPR